MKADTEVPLTLTNPGPTSMTIARAVREANSSREVYLLLAAYLEAVRLGGELIEPFREIATAPLVSIDDVKERTLQLFFMLQAVSKSLDDNSRVAVKEALCVFGAVLDRLKFARGEHRPRGTLLQGHGWGQAYTLYLIQRKFDA